MYTPYERLTKFLELARKDPDCAACARDMAQAEQLLEDYLAEKSPEDSKVCNALPVTMRIYYGRLLELACREMMFPGEP